MERIITTKTEYWINDIAIALTHNRILHSDMEFLADVKERLTRLVTSILTDTEDYFSME